MENKEIYFGYSFYNIEEIAESNKKKYLDKFDMLYSTEFAQNWENMEMGTILPDDVEVNPPISVDKAQGMSFLFDIPSNKIDRTLSFRNETAEISFSWGIKDYCSMGMDLKSPPFPGTQSAAESFRDFALSFIWDYSLLKSFSVDVPLGREGWEQVAEGLELGSPGTIKDSWVQILSPADYSNFFTKEQMLAAPAYYVEELPEGRVLYQLYPNPWADPSTPELAEYLNPLYHYLQKIKYPDSL